MAHVLLECRATAVTALPLERVLVIVTARADYTRPHLCRDTPGLRVIAVRPTIDPYTVLPQLLWHDLCSLPDATAETAEEFVVSSCGPRAQLSPALATAVRMSSMIDAHPGGVLLCQLPYLYRSEYGEAWHASAAATAGTSLRSWMTVHCRGVVTKYEAGGEPRYFKQVRWRRGSGGVPLHA